MKVFNQEEIDKAAELKYPQRGIITDFTQTRQNDFKAGVSFAEEKFEKIAAEFLRWYKCINYEEDYLGFTTQDLVKQFLKERH